MKKARKKSKATKSSGRPRKASPASKAPAEPRSRRPGDLFDALVEVQRRLLAPGGCPWDREQTHDTLRPYLIEEAYEVLDALDSGDADHVAEELGDLLLQVLFHAQLAALAGRFDISNVIEHIRTKLIRRHPHVFGEVKADTAAQVLKNWEQLKGEEKRAKAEKKGAPAMQSAPASVLDGVPRTLPSLLEGYQLTRKAAKVGFDWKAAPDILDKLAEESAELRSVLQAGNPGRIEDEFGDLLFACVNVGRFLGLDSEIALKKANLKFSRRFREMERLAASRGSELARMSSDALESLWGEAKQRIP